MQILIILLLSVFYGWRYSLTSVDPDWAMFNLRAFTGSKYGKDFVDCKTPAVHWYYYALAKMVGANVKGVKFVNHFLLGSAGVIVYLLTDNFYAALAYTFLINSGWLLAFHGNVSQVPTALMVIALALNDPRFSPILFILAVLFEPKLLPSLVVVSLLNAWWVSLLIIPIIAFTWGFDKDWWYSSVTIPYRMSKNRNDEFYYKWVPWYLSNGLLYILPWILFAVVMNNSLLYWAPAVVYAVVIAMGKVIRQNHLIPIIPWIVLSGIDPALVVILCLVDFLSSGLYFGDIWARYYPALAGINEEARIVGDELIETPGSLWVNGIHTGIYIHARKPVPFGLAEQIEIREVAHERRERMKELFKINPPDWIVVGTAPGIKFKPSGYQVYKVVGEHTIFQRI